MLGTILIGSAIPAAAAGGPYLVKNINMSGSSSPEQLTAVGGTLFFTADDGVHGRELWKSDGTAVGTQLVRDIRPGADGFDEPYSLTAIGGLLYFNADDGIHGRELWVSDGTEAGTRMLKDIVPGSGRWSEPHGFAEYGGAIYFSAGTVTNGRELWRTDGTAEGTYLVADIVPGAEGSDPYNLIVFAGKLYFLRAYYDGGLDHAVLYRTDGTSSGTKPFRDRKGNKISGRFGYAPRLWVVGGSLFIGRNYRELWSSKGTSATTGKIADIGTTRVVDVGGTAFFEYFRGDPYPVSGLWRSDGTKSGTLPLSYSDGAPARGVAGLLAGFADTLIFFADGLSVSDGTTEGTERLNVPAIPVEVNEYWFATQSLAVIDSAVYFGGHTYDAEGKQTSPALWRTDGTTDGTYAVSQGYAGGILGSITRVGEAMFFVSKAGKGVELYRYLP